MANWRAVLGSSMKRLLLTVSVAIGIATLPAAGVLSFLLTPQGNEWLRGHLEKYLSQKLNTRVTIGRIHLSSVHQLTIFDFKVLDRSGQTLIAFQTLLLKPHWSYLWKSGNSFLKEVRIQQFSSRIDRRADATDFNYQFVLDSFTSSENQPDDSQPDLSWLVPDQIDFRDISLHYDDKKTGDRAAIAFARLNAGVYVMNEVIPTKWILRSMLLDSAVVELKRGADTTENLFIQSRIGNIQLANGYFTGSEPRLHANRILIRDHFTTFRSAPAGQATGVSPESRLAVSIDTLLLSHNRFAIDLKNHKKGSSKAFDPFHNDYQQIDASASGLRYGPGEVSARISHLSLVDARRFRLRALAADVIVGDKKTEISDLQLSTPHNKLTVNILWRYPSLRQALADPESGRFDISAGANTLNLGEVAYFLPVLLRYDEIAPLYRQHIRLSVRAGGSPRDIRLHAFDIVTPRNRLQGSGGIHTPKRGDTWLDVAVRSGSSGRTGLGEIVSPGVISPALLDKIPDRVLFAGKMRISSGLITSALTLNTDAGMLRVNGQLKHFSNPDKTGYDFSYNARELEIGKILKDTLLGALTSHGHIRGTGLGELSKIKLEAAGYADRLVIGGRTIESVLFQTGLANGRLQGSLASSHPDLSFELAPTLYLTGTDSIGSIRGNVFRADLRKLALLKDTLVIGAWISADLSRFSKDTLIGNLKLSSAEAQFRGKTYQLGALNLDVSHPGEEQVMQLRSELADIDLSGRFQITKIPDFPARLTQAVMTSASFPAADSIGSFKIQGWVHMPTELLPLLPSVSQMAPFSFQSRYDAAERLFEFQTAIDSLTVDGIAFDSIRVQLQTNKHTNSGPETNYLLSAKNIHAPSVKLPRIKLSGDIRDGVHRGELSSSETSDGSLFRIPFAYHAREARPFVTLADSLYFKGERWQVNPGNAVYVTGNRFEGSQITLRNGSKSANFTASGNGGLPYELSFSNISLGPLFALMKADSTFLTGMASGSVSVKELSPFALVTNIKIEDLKAKGTDLGKLTAEVQSEPDNRYALRMDLTRDAPILRATGSYAPSKGTGLLAVTIDALPVSALDGLMEQVVDSLQGNLRGNVTVKIDTSKTDVQGLVTIDSSSFIVRETGGRIQLAGGGLVFSNDQVRLQPILLRDGAGGEGTLTGSVHLKDLQHADYHLNLDAKRFRTIAGLRRRDQLVYGNGKTNANLELTGNLNELRLTGNVSLQDSSQIFYRSAAATKPDFGEGLLEFTRPDADNTAAAPAGSIRKLINTNIAVPQNVTLYIILDEYRGEKVVVRGKSSLNYSQHAGGEMQLNGKYEVTSGTYTFSVGNNIKKMFSLENGGTIQWLGDVYQPVCDLTAIYKVTTSAGSLMQGTDTDSEAARRKFDFLVKMKLKGNLSKPEITFTLDMNEKDQDAFDGAVYSKIKQLNNSPSDVTKQVMSLLVLNSFMGDSPFGSLSQFSNAALEVGAYNTVGNLLTRELNNMLAGMVKAVDITLGVNWSQSVDGGRSSTRSDIKLGLGKSLFNHRLNLYVGNNFGIETLSGTNSGFSGLANDVSVEYLLNPEGKYRIKGYHVRDNELTLHGEHMETGVKFTIIWEFDKQDLKKARHISPRSTP